MGFDLRRLSAEFTEQLGLFDGYSRRFLPLCDGFSSVEYGEGIDWKCFVGSNLDRTSQMG